MTLQRKLSDSESQTQKDSRALTQLRTEVAQLQSQVSVASTEKATLGSKADQLAKDKQKAKDVALQQIKDAQSQALQAEQQVADLKLQLKHKESEMSRAEKAHEKEAEKATEQAAKAKAAEVTKLEGKLTAQLTELNTTKAKLQQEQTRAVELLKSKSLESDAVSQEISKLQGDFLAAHTKVCSLNACLVCSKISS